MVAHDLFLVGNSTNKVYRRAGGYSGASWDSGIAGPTGETAPRDIAFDIIGDLYLVGNSSDKVYRRAGGYGGSSWDSGIGLPTGVHFMTGIAFDDAGNLYGVGQNTSKIYKRAGGYGGSSWDSGIAGPSGVSFLTAIAFDDSGNLYVLDRATAKVYRRAGGYSGTSWDSGIAVPTGETLPTGIAFDADGDLLLTGLSSDKVYRRAGGYGGSSWDSGIAGPTGETAPTGIATLAVIPTENDIVVADTITHTIVHHRAEAIGAVAAIDGPPLAPIVHLVAYGSDYATLSWAAPFSGSPILRYEGQKNGGTWVDVGLVPGLAYRWSDLTPGTLYRLRIRAVSALGSGAPSATVDVTTTVWQAASAPRYLVAGPSDVPSHIEITWIPPLLRGPPPITHYEVETFDPAGQSTGWERTPDTELTWRVRGLHPWHRYGIRVRAVNAAGAGAPTDIVYVTPQPPLPATRRLGQRIPLRDHDRQSVIIHVAGQDCRVTVWWHPSDQGWWASLEVPVNTMVVAARRLPLNAGILDRITDVLPGNIVLRELGGAEAEPARDAWARPTHGLFWEPDA